MRRIYLTVDTECHDIKKLNQYIYGKKGNDSFGLPKILEVGKRLNVPVNVFLDVCECQRYGDKYTQDIVELVHSYEQPIYFHFHPNFLSGDDNRTFLWQYSEEEQRKLITSGLETYYKFCWKSDRLIFRAGRYGVNETTFKIFNEMGLDILDLSYFSYSAKMCKLPTDKVNVMNRPTMYKGVTMLPNTTYIGFNYLNKFHAFILNVAQTTHNEFRRFISQTKLNDVVYTMHSWDFIRKWFFLDKYIQCDNAVIRKFEKCVKEARNAGFTFCKVEDFQYDENQEDELIDLCTGLNGKVCGIFNNFIRFYCIGRLTKKYFYCYALLAILLLLIVVGTIFVLI